MKVAARLTLTAATLVALLGGVLVYDLSLVRSLDAVNRDLSEIRLRATAVAIEQDRLVAGIDEFGRKLLVTRDPDYAAGLVGLRRSFAEGLAELGALGLSPAEQVEVERLRRMWDELPLDAFADEALRVEVGSDQEARLTDLLAVSMAALRDQVAKVLDATQREVAVRVERAARASRQARRISWGILVLAVGLGLPALWLAIRSIHHPLKRLTAGIRAVAAGDFTQRVGAAGDDELARLAASFNEMSRRLGELERVKQDLLSRVSHELKTPLVAMLETNKLLLEELPGALNPRQRRLVEFNLQGSERLEEMISKLLDLSRLEAGRVEYEFAGEDLTEIVVAAAAGFEAVARERGVDLRIGHPATPVPVCCDRGRITQVVELLIENAVKFSPGNGVVGVRIEPPAPAADLGDSEPAPESRACVEISDTGPGVPDELKERVFERFFQVDPDGGRRSGRGVGLGLAICREIVSAHGGELSVRDNAGPGATFSFSLPVTGTAVASAVSG